MDNPSQINRVNASQSLLYTKIGCLNKKRKFPAEESGLPLPKHKCSSSYAFDFSSSSNTNPEVLNPYLFKGETSERSAYNSLSRDVDSIMSISESDKSSMYDQPSTSYVNWGNSSFAKTVYSLESRSVTKSTSDKMELSSYIDGDNFGLHSSPIYQDLDDYSCAEYPIEDCDDKKLEDLLYSNGNGENSNNFVLSSGRWNVNQDTDQGAEKLTIDKEFEQYFSMLML